MSLKTLLAVLKLQFIKSTAMMFILFWNEMNLQVVQSLWGLRKSSQVFIPPSFYQCMKSNRIIAPVVLRSPGKTLSAPWKADSWNAKSLSVWEFGLHPTAAGKSGRHAVSPKVYCGTKNIPLFFSSHLLSCLSHAVFMVSLQVTLPSHAKWQNWVPANKHWH